MVIEKQLLCKKLLDGCKKHAKNSAMQSLILSFALLSYNYSKCKTVQYNEEKISP